MKKEEFIQIIEKYLSGEASPSEKRLIDTFFSAQEKSQFKEHIPTSEDMWDQIENRLFDKDLSPPETSGTRRTYLVMTLSVLLFAVVGFCAYMLAVGTESEIITKVAPYGEKSILLLTDGTKVFLNSGSSISFPKEFAADVREVTLCGEAFFEVTRNPLRPFLVRSGNVTTKVLGTSFNVQAFEWNEISVTVATGKVQVVAAIGNSTPEEVKQLILNPKQQGVFRNQEWTTFEADLSKSLAWRNNTLRFDEARLSDVAAILQRWYNIQIDFENDEILNCSINGQFKDQSLENVLKSIQYMYNVDFKFLTQNQIILYGKGCSN